MDAVPKFELWDVQVLPELCKDSDCSHDKRTYLAEFTKLQSEFCLAFLITYQDFKGPEGSAYTESLCAKRKNGRSNTGFITALNFEVSTLKS